MSNFSLKPTVINRNNPRQLIHRLESVSMIDDDFEPMSLEKIQSIFRLHGRKIKTGCKQIDNLLTGGIPVNGIVEISGESSCGKTQILLQLSITVQYPEEMGGLNAGVIYICTEDSFPSKRFSDLCDKFVKHLPKPPQNIEFGKNVFVIHVYDLKQLEACINEQIPNLMSRMKVGLIIIDSIAGVFRYDDVPLEEKLQIMYRVAKKLHDFIADDYIAVVCSNQVTTEIDVNGVSKLLPSLGDSWTQHVLTRIELYRSRDECIERERTFRITAARDLCLGSCKFTIQPHGIV